MSGKTGGTQHLRSALVVYDEVVDDDSVENTYINPADLYLRAEFFTQYLGCLTTNVFLYGCGVQQYKKQCYDAQQ